MTSSVARGNVTGLLLDDTTAAIVTDSVFTGNGNGIINRGNLTLGNSVIAINPTAINNMGSLYTRQNNTLGGNYAGNAAIPFGAF